MSSACVCHTDEWCFYCNMYTPLEKKLELAVGALEKELADAITWDNHGTVKRIEKALLEIRGIEK